jgi:hypothetical protein
MSELTPHELMNAALKALLEADERWLLMGTNVVRTWPDGTTDTLILLGPETAYGVREAPDGRRPWSMGPAQAEAILYHAKRLLPPDHPDGPKALDAGLPRAEWRDGL